MAAASMRRRGGLAQSQPVLLLVLLSLSQAAWGFHYYLAEDKYCKLALEPGVKIMGKPVQPSSLPQSILVTRAATNEPVSSGEAFVPGEVLRVAFNASLVDDEDSRKRLTWVAEASLPSFLFHSESDPARDAALAENSRVQCEARAVMRAVPGTGEDFVLWKMPDAGNETGSEGVWLAVAFAWRYGVVQLTDRFVLAAPGSAGGHREF